jgi:hypothetical protein
MIKGRPLSMQSVLLEFGSHRLGGVMRLSLTMMVCAIVLSGCAAHERPMPHYAKDGGSVTQEQFLQERYVCLQQAQQGRAVGGGDQYGASYSASVVTNKQIYISCMAARGYRVDPNGPLTVPRDAVVRTHRSLGYLELSDSEF